MKTRPFLPVVAVLLTALALPPMLFAQSTNVRPRNKNLSPKFKSGITRGSGNLILSNSLASFIGGGQSNTIGLASGYGSWNAFNSVIAGGFGNSALRELAAIGGGTFNTNEGTAGTISGGQLNRVAAPYAAIGGGIYNTNIGYAATVAGGYANLATAHYVSVGGGVANLASGSNSVVSGGETNYATGIAATVAGGSLNEANGSRSAIGGGYNNQTTGILATVPGGNGNSATNYSFAAGRYAIAEHEGSFVWGCAQGITVSLTRSFGTNTFTARAIGGARFYTSATGTNAGVNLTAGGTSWASLSDSNAKTGIQPIQPREILAKVAALPVTSWNYKHDSERRYIGPMSQDFHAAFGLGHDDKTISTLDSDGVMYAAIKGLVQELNERDQAMAARDQAIEELEVKLQALEHRLNAILNGR